MHIAFGYQVGSRINSQNHNLHLLKHAQICYELSPEMHRLDSRPSHLQTPSYHGTQARLGQKSGLRDLKQACVRTWVSLGTGKPSTPSPQRPKGVVPVLNRKHQILQALLQIIYRLPHYCKNLDMKIRKHPIMMISAQLFCPLTISPGS